MSGPGYVGLAVGSVAILLVFFGEPLQRAWAQRRLRCHMCPTPCEESRRCRCGCNGVHPKGERQERCGLCGTPIVYDDEDDDRDWGPYNSGAITQEIVRPPVPPMRQTSWGKEREDREDGHV